MVQTSSAVFPGLTRDFSFWHFSTMDEVYEIEEILKQGTNKHKETQYFIKWSGYDDSYNSWHTVEQLDEMGVEDVSIHIKSFKAKPKTPVAAPTPAPTKKPKKLVWLHQFFLFISQSAYDEAMLENQKKAAERYQIELKEREVNDLISPFVSSPRLKP